MTRDADLKKLVRSRMESTGENYTTARQHLLEVEKPAAADLPAPCEDGPAPEEFLAAQAEQRRTVGRFIVDGRLRQLPMRRRARAAVLLELVALFEPGRSYPESEVNEILGAVHDDFAFWRRELVNYGYLLRQASVYRLPVTAPHRPASMAQEIPAWEALWLPGHLAGEQCS